MVTFTSKAPWYVSQTRKVSQPFELDDFPLFFKSIDITVQLIAIQPNKIQHKWVWSDIVKDSFLSVQGCDDIVTCPIVRAETLCIEEMFFFKLTWGHISDCYLNLEFLKGNSFMFIRVTWWWLLQSFASK